jgi:hypothetical protein
MKNRSNNAKNRMLLASHGSVKRAGGGSRQQFTINDRAKAFNTGRRQPDRRNPIAKSGSLSVIATHTQLPRVG